MDLALNTRLDPRVLVPWTGANTTEPLSTDPDQYIPDWRGAGSTWDAYRRHCPPHTSARALYRSLRPARGGSRGALLGAAGGAVPGPFAPGPLSRTDFCGTPSAHTLHGLFFSDMRPVAARLPVLSPARAPGFADVRVPSHYYYWPSRRHTYGFDAVNLVVAEADARELPWAAKSARIWWRGPSTGGGGTPPGHAARYQRHRLLALAAENSSALRTVTFPAGGMHRAAVPVGALNGDTFDLAFTRPAGDGNWPGGTAGLRASFPFAEDGTALGARWASKYALDVDGGGYSGAFLALMESDSAVLKAGVFAEFWERWAVPWLHYVPLSAGYAELYDLHAYFSGPGPATRAAAGKSLNETELARARDEGDRRLRRIARAGKNWRRTVARGVDMEGPSACAFVGGGAAADAPRSVRVSAYARVCPAVGGRPRVDGLRALSANGRCLGCMASECRVLVECIICFVASSNVTP
jgi:hypothetical protein